MSKRGYVWLGVILIGGIASYFTVSGNEAVKWNDKAVEKYRRFGAAWTRLQPLVVTWLQGKAVDAAKLDAAVAQYGKEINQAAGDLRRETPPDDELCKAFHAEMVKFADLEEAQVAEIAKLCGQMKATNPGGAEDIKKVTEALEALGKKEDAQQNLVQAKQKQMAAKFKLKMK
jgi:hypothetical protein